MFFYGIFTASVAFCDMPSQTNPPVGGELQRQVSGDQNPSELHCVINLAGLQAQSPAVCPAVFLRDPIRQGVFRFDYADLSAEVASDPRQGVYVAPVSDTTGASGAWVRQFNHLELRFFGAVRDGIADDTAAREALHAFAAANGIADVYYGGGTIRLTNVQTGGYVSGVPAFHVHGEGALLTFDAIDRSQYPARGEAMFFNMDYVDELYIEDLSWTMTHRQFTQAQVMDVQPSHVDIQIDPEFPMHWFSSDPVADTVFEFDPETKAVGEGGWVHARHKGTMDVVSLGGDKYRLQNGGIMPGRWSIGRWYYIAYHREGYRSARFRNVKNLKFSNVVEIQGSGLMIQNGENIDTSGYRVERRDGAVIACATDAVHLKNWRGYYIHNGGIIEGCGDDVINVHTDFLDIQSIDDGVGFTGGLHLFAAAHLNPDFRVGDTWRFYNRNGEPHPDGYRVAVEVTAHSSDRVSVVFDSLPDGVDDSYFAVDMSAIGDCDISNLKCGYSIGGIVVQGKRSVVSNNRLRHVAKAAIVAVPYSTVFNEGPEPQRIQITGNNCVECSKKNWRGNEPGVIVVGMPQFVRGKGYAKAAMIPGVIVANNTIDGSGIAAVVLQNCISPVLSNNIAMDVNRSFVNIMAGYPFALSYCSDPRISGQISISAGTAKIYGKNITGKAVLGDNPGLDVSDF